jgi:hypothetical protein
MLWLTLRVKKKFEPSYLFYKPIVIHVLRTGYDLLIEKKLANLIQFGN